MKMSSVGNRNSRKSLLALAVTAAVGLGLASSAVRATTLYWDPNYISGDGISGGSGNWSSPVYNTNSQTINYTADWSTSSTATAVPDQRWYQSGLPLYALDPALNVAPDAVFGGANGTPYNSLVQTSANGAYFVNLGNAEIAVNSLNFNTSGYTLTGSPLTLTGGVITFNNSGTTILSTAIDGTAGLTLSSNAGGTLWLNSVNSFYTGVTTIKSGTVVFTGNNNSTNTPAGVAVRPGSFGSSYTSPVLLGDTTGSANATLGLQAGIGGVFDNTYSRSLTIQGGNTGTSTLAIMPGLGSNATNYVYGDAQFQSSGGILLQHDLTLQSIANSRLYIGQNTATVVSGAGNLNITGPGVVYMDNNTTNGANSFTGNINVNQGTFEVNNDDAMGTGNVNSTVTFAANTAWRMDGGSNGRVGGNDTRNYVINGSGVVWSRSNGGNSFNIAGTITDNGNGLTITDDGLGYAAVSNNYFTIESNQSSTLTGKLSIQGSSLGIMSLASGSALGAAASNVSLNEGNLTIKGQTGGLAIVKTGGLTFSGASQLYLDDNNVTATASASLTVGSLTRSGNGTLLIRPWQNNGVFRTSESLYSTAAPAVVSGIVAPYYRNTDGNFLTYGANGFANATYTVGGATQNVDGTAGHTLANTVAADNVWLNTVADNTMLAATTYTVNSLYTDHNIGQAAAAGSGTVLQVGSGGLSMAGPTISVDALDFNGKEALIFSNNNTSTISSVIQNTGGNGVTIFGGNNLTMNGTLSNTYTGATRIQQGTLTLNKIGPSQTAATNTAVAVPGDVLVDLYGTMSDSASKQLGAASNVTVAGTWNLNNNTESIASLTINNTSQNYGLSRGGGTVSMGTGTGANSLTLGSLTINAGGTFNVNGTNGSNANNFVTVSGAGVTTLTSQTIDGFNTIAFMNVQDKNAFNTGTGGLALTGGQIQLNGSTASVINLNGPVTTYASPFYSYLGYYNNNSNKGQVAMGANNIVFTVADGPAVDDLIIDAQITGTNGLTKTGPGQMEIMSPNTASTYTGDTTILQGTLLVDFAVPNGTIQLGGANQVGNSTFLMNGGYTFARPINISAGGTGTVSIGTTNQNHVTLSNTITVNKAINLYSADTANTLEFLSTAIFSGAGNITKLGAGNIQIDAPNPAYTGQISVLEGQLAITSSAGTGMGSGTSDILLGNTSGTANVTLSLDNGTYTGRNITVQSGSTGTATIGSVNNNNNATFTGNLTFNKSIILYSDSHTFTLNGILSDNGTNSSVDKNGNNTWVAQINGTTIAAPSFGGNTTVNQGTLRLQFNQPTSAAASIAFGSGNIVIDGGVFDLATNATANGTTNSLINLTNNVVVTPAGGSFGGDTNNTYNALQFSGTIALGGMLKINNNQNQGGATAAVLTNYSGTITLDQSTAYNKGIIYQQQGGTQNGQVTGAIVDGAGAYGQPLILANNSGSTFVFNTPTASATWANGTRIQADTSNGLVSVTSTSALGTGNVEVMSGGLLRLAAATNVNTAGGATLTLDSTSLTPSLLSIAGDFAAPGVSASSSSGILAVDTATYTQDPEAGNSRFVGSFSGGTITGSTLTAGTGNTYRLGGGGNTLTIANSVLIGSNNLIVGQVGGQVPNGTLYGVVRGQGNVKLNANQALTGTITINGGTSNGGYSNTVLESVVQATGQPLGTGATNVTLNSGTLQFDPTATASPRTDITIGNLTVIGGESTLATSSTNTGSVLTVNGANGIVRDNNASLFITASSPANLGAGGMKVMVANSISGTSTNAPTYIGNTNSANGSNGMVTVNGVVAPWITYMAPSSAGTPEGGDFLAYDAVNGFVATTYTVGGAVHALDQTAGFKLANTIPTDIVKFSVTGTPDNSMTANTTVYAFRSGGIGNGGQVVTSSGASAVTLTITSGALSCDEQNGTITFGTVVATPNSYVNLKFGGTTATDGITTEAVLWASNYNGSGNINILNGVMAASLTKTGPGNVNLYSIGTTSSALANPIPGTITINSGYVTTGNNNTSSEFAMGPGTGSNFVLLNGGQWTINGDLAANVTHNIEVGPNGGALGLANQSKTYTGNITDYASADGTAAGPLSLYSNNQTMTLNNATAGTNTWSGGTNVYGVNNSATSVIIAAGTHMGTGDVTIRSGALRVQSDVAISNTAHVAVLPNTTLYVQSDAQNIGSLEGSGYVVLGGVDDTQNNPTFVASTINSNTPLTGGTGTGDARTVLTVGNNNASTTFDGIIMDNVGDKGTGAYANIAATRGDGYLVKVGTGNLTLTNVQAYSGSTTVNNGTLTILGSIPSTGALNITSVGGTTPQVLLMGTVGGAVNVNNLGTLRGVGSVGGLITVGSGGTIDLGKIPASVGNMTTAGGLDMSGGGVFDWGLASLSTSPGAYDTISLTGGNLKLNGSSTLTLDFGLLATALKPGNGDPFWASNKSWQIIGLSNGATNTNGSTSTNFAVLNNAAFGGSTFNTSVDASGNIWLNYVAQMVNQWQAASGTAWDGTTAANWSASPIPHLAGDQANFFGVGTATNTVNVSGAITVGKMTFSNAMGAVAYTIAGNTPSDVLTLDNTGGTGNAVIGVGAGMTAPVISVPLVLANTDLTITNANPGDLTISGGISQTVGQTRAVTITQGGVLLSGASTYTGQTHANAGSSIDIGAAGATLASQVNLDTGGVLNLNNNMATIGSLVGSGTVHIGTGTLSTGSDNSNTSFSGGIDGSGTLTKAGNGSMTIANAIAFNGTVSVTGGTLTPANLSVSAVNVSAGTYTVPAATTTTVSSGLTVSGTGTITGSGLVVGTLNYNSSAASTFAGGVRGALNYGSGANSTFSGNISGTGGIAMTGSGILNLSGSGSYTGSTNITNGTVNAAATSLGAGPLNVGLGSVLNITGNSAASSISGFGAMTLNGGASSTTSALTLTTAAGQARAAWTTTPVTVTDAAGFTASFVYTATAGTGGGALADGATFDLENSSNTAIGGNGGSLGYQGITPSGSVQFNIYNSSSTGWATAGALNKAQYTTPSNVNLASGDPILVNLSYTGTTLTEVLTDQTTAGTVTYTYPNINIETVLGGQTAYVGFTGGSGGLGSTQTITNFSFNNNLGGPAFANLTGAGQINVSNTPLTVGTDSTSTAFSGAINGGVDLVKVGSGALTLSGSNGYSGKTNIQAGTIRIGADNTLPTATTLAMGTTTTNGTLDLNAHTQTVGALAVGTGATAGSQIITNNTVGTGTLVYAGTGSATFAGTIQDGGPGKLAALTVSSGNLTVTGTNSYSGGTNITGGSMNSTGTALGTGTVAISAGAKLSVGIATPSIAMHWSDYYVTAPTNITGTDGVVPNSHWTNVEAGWYGATPSNNHTALVDSTGTATTVAVGDGATGAGTYWSAGGPANYPAGTDNLLQGAWGGNGPVPTVITGIPASYGTYTIIAYVNTPSLAPYGTIGQTSKAWLDGNPAFSSAFNAPATNRTYYFSNDTHAFDQITNNTDPTTFNPGNYIVYSGLTGTSQTLWSQAFGPNPAANWGFTGFEIVAGPSGSSLILGGLTGAGTFDLQGNNAYVGNNNANAVFTGNIISSGGNPGSLTKLGTGTQTLANLPLNVTITGGVLQLAAGGTSHTLATLSSLVLAGGNLDLTNHDLYIANGAAYLSTYEGLAGSMITTSTTVPAHNAGAAQTAIALLPGSDYLGLGKTSLDGQAVGANDLVGVLALAGDANLDGTITADDYLALNLGSIFNLSGWVHGDFAQKGFLEASDYAIIDNSYLHQSGAVADAEIALHTQWFGAAYTDAFNALNAPAAVPEPASLALLAIGAVGLLRRKK